MDNPIISCIKPGIYVGNMIAARNEEILQREEIRNVVSVMKWEFPPQEREALYQKLGIIWKKFPIADHYEFTDSEGRLTTEIFPWMKIAELVYEEATLVHCEMGISRSTSLVIAYLVWGGMPFEPAFKLITDKHPITKPSFEVIESFLKHIGAFVPNLAEILYKDSERAYREIISRGL